MRNVRADFEKWLMDVHMLDSVWNEQRNCFDDFPAHLAFKAWQAALALEEERNKPCTSETHDWIDFGGRNQQMCAKCGCGRSKP